ncbi:hypothetical protein K469DRAFT_360820 [Zopfia rhizophila CBS 207.26]|uniref:Uncharacterized protein n=1 Tax=Zopfia rhizophila CBS 207.26 TaxID=1314779 RepID=A0A6A6EGZ5_9PEZI|nr:hypothetical protein K469DRAFT_360820 [Zopfia rhizophila CBS 207.26]
MKTKFPGCHHPRREALYLHRSAAISYADSPLGTDSESPFSHGIISPFLNPGSKSRPWSGNQCSRTPTPVLQPLLTHVFAHFRIYLKKKNQQAVLRSRKYLDAYNANPSPCTESWGHRGGEWDIMFRSKPTLFLLAFLGFTFYQFAKGIVCNF